MGPSDGSPVLPGTRRRGPAPPRLCLPQGCGAPILPTRQLSRKAPPRNRAGGRVDWGYGGDARIFTEPMSTSAWVGASPVDRATPALGSLLADGEVRAITNRPHEAN